jgi:hypothetical protein
VAPCRGRDVRRSRETDPHAGHVAGRDDTCLAAQLDRCVVAHGDAVLDKYLCSVRELYARDADVLVAAGVHSVVGRISAGAAEHGNPDGPVEDEPGNTPVKQDEGYAIPRDDADGYGRGHAVLLLDGRALPN